MNLFNTIFAIVLTLITVCMFFRPGISAEIGDVSWQPNATIQRNLEMGQPVEVVMRNVLLWKGMVPQTVISNMYCLGVDGKDILKAAKSNGIDDKTFVEGYKQSIIDCNNAAVEPEVDLEPDGSFIKP